MREPLHNNEDGSRTQVTLSAVVSVVPSMIGLVPACGHRDIAWSQPRRVHMLRQVRNGLAIQIVLAVGAMANALLLISCYLEQEAPS